MFFRVLCLALAGSWTVIAHDLITTKLTWSQEISRIIYKRCAGCHGEGARPISLVSYEEARPWAKAIRDEVLNRRMPPWGAVKGFGEFRNDSSLTQDEIARIAQWVEGGAPEGDPAYMPAKPHARAAEPLPAGIRLRRLPPSRAVVLIGIRPLADAGDSKIAAHLPGGVIEPLIWLRDYKRKWNRTFIYREPLKLPAGTRIVADPPAPFELLVTMTAGKRQ